MPSSPIVSGQDLVTISILIAGTAMSSLYQVFSVEVGKGVGKIPYAKIKLEDGSAPDQDFPISAKSDFVPGTEIEIKAGYNSTESSIFKGVIVKHGVRVKSNRSTLVIECRDKAIKMTFGRKCDIATNKLDSAIISTLIGNAGLSADVTATKVTHKEIIQYYVSDWDFMLLRAEANGLMVNVEAGKVSVKVPDTSPAAALVVTYGLSIIEANLDIDALGQTPGAEASAWDAATQKMVKGTAPSSSLKTTGNVPYSTLSKIMSSENSKLLSSASLPSGELTAWATGKLNKANLSKVTGKVRFQGNSTIKPMAMLELAGLGARFNGDAFVGAVYHYIEGGEWFTDAHIGVSFDWFCEEAQNVEPPFASGLMSPMKGLHIGIVTKMHADPDGLYRVQVKIPTLQKDSVMIWARMANFYATVKAGEFFYPEIGDEVILGFLNEDPRHPIILGSMYNKTNMPPVTPADKNFIKTIVSNKKMLIKFDDENVIFTIDTPDKNTIILDDKTDKITIIDVNKNKIEMSSTGILIESCKDINIKAPKGDVNITAININDKATANVSIKGIQVTAEGAAQFTGKGAMAEVSASGITTIKGALVKIN